MKAKSILVLALAAACAASTTSCRRLKPSSAGLVVESYPKTQIKVNSRFFDGYFEVSQCNVAKGNNGLLQATVVLENKKGDCQIEYRYRWLDGNGIEIGGGTTVWTPMSVGSKEQKLLTGIAPSKNVDDFVLDVRLAYKSTRW